ncbi:AAA family ATPase [Hymenobacter terrestris]|uniref:AAA family ATPase n=1 Tax=Hymenobacter terrestris TaxID=2748310 RepID=A0ABX2PZB7_9BACT|nr:AAA family ATPase [Hymenobacter terrestris]NVO83475.1 AAA family ATPase [Hymenobacter terrestris]
MSDTAAAPGYPRLTYLRIKNYRALRDVELRDLTPLTVFIGPNGSGKSTILDALAFLAEAVSGNLQQAWEKRNRFAGIRTRGQEGPIEFEVGALLSKNTRVHYEVSFIEQEDQLDVANEVFWITGSTMIRLFYANQPVLTKPHGDVRGAVVRNAYYSDTDDQMRIIPGKNPYLYYSHLFNRTEEGQVVGIDSELASLFRSYRYIHLTDDHLKGYSDAGPREKLSDNGDNLPNVLYYLHEKHPETLARITAQLRRWVPQLADVVPEITSDERLLLRFKDAAFEKPLPAQYMSDGTMRLAALLTLLYEPNATGLLGIEEPENELHPRLLPRLAEELLKATDTRQLLVATHSPFLLDALEPEQVWILHRGDDGYTQATRTADIPQVKELVEDGSPLGYLWTSNFFRLGDPLTPRTPAAR